MDSRFQELYRLGFISPAQDAIVINESLVFGLLGSPWSPKKRFIHVILAGDWRY